MIQAFISILVSVYSIVLEVRVEKHRENRLLAQYTLEVPEITEDEESEVRTWLATLNAQIGSLEIQSRITRNILLTGSDVQSATGKHVLKPRNHIIVTFFRHC